jgi:hypothetical protein
MYRVITLEWFSISTEPTPCKLFMLVVRDAKMLLAALPCQLDLFLPFSKTFGAGRVLSRFTMMTTDTVLIIWVGHI